MTYHDVVRTTIDVDDRLLRVARERATAARTSLSRLVEEALRAFLTLETASADEPFDLITYGRPGGAFPSPADMAAVLDDEESPTLRGR